MSPKKYRFGYGSKIVNYSDSLADQIRAQRAESAKNFRESFIGSHNISIGKNAGSEKVKGSDLINSLAETSIAINNMSKSISLIPNSHSFKMIIPIGNKKDGVWKKIKHTLGFKDDLDHTDKNYRT